MPELPEVETIKLGLEKKIVGLTIKKVENKVPKLFTGNPKEVEGKKVLKVWRRGKVLGIDLSDGLTLLFHLKMTGQLVFVEKGKRMIGGHPTKDMLGELPNKTSHNIFYFTNGSTLYFNDLRKFGWVKLVETSKVDEQKFLQSLGPEPLEKNFTPNVLKTNLLKRKNLPVKVALLDQTIVSGIGNIYACEALFLAKIHPNKKISELTDKDFEVLHQGIVKALKESIKHGGSTRKNYVNSEGERGYFLDFAYVYDREEKQCKECGGEIDKIKLGGRGTYYCKVCQK